MFAVTLLMGQDAFVHAVESASSAGQQGAWKDDARRFRCRIQVTPPKSPGKNCVARIFLATVQNDLNALGLHGSIDPNSICVKPVSQSMASGIAAYPLSVNAGEIRWAMTADSSSRWPQTVEMYFDVARQDASVPPVGRAWPPRKAEPIAFSEYAADAYHDAWDFDANGNFEGIDDWSAGVRNRQVKDGILSMDVLGDPYFIWGRMWNAGRTNRPVAIDLQKYPVLEMKIRQSCPATTWTLYGRTDSAGLMSYEFGVSGDRWQIVRINLLKEARWSGLLTAFRIGTAYQTKSVHLEFDWIRLISVAQAEPGAVECLGPPNVKPAKVTLAPERRSTQVGSRQTIIVNATDAKGAPVCGQPITVSLSALSRGVLEAGSQRSLALGPYARRGLTDAKGCLDFVLQSSRKAGADVVEAKADFTTVTAAVAVDAVPGLPDHYAVRPFHSVCVEARQLPQGIQVQLVDKFGNSLAVAGRHVTLKVSPGARIEPTDAVTNAAGCVRAMFSADAAKRWVYRVEAADDTGCKGTSPAISVLPSQPRANPIQLLPNGYFAYADGRPFVPLGGFYANWVQTETPDGEWNKHNSFTDTTDEQKRRWMQYLHDNGVTAIRMMLRTHRPQGTEPMDIGGRVNPALFAETLRYMDLAREFDLQFQLVLHEDYDKTVYFNEKHLRTYALPAWDRLELNTLMPAQRRFLRDVNLISTAHDRYYDFDAIACQDAFAREIIMKLRNIPQAFAYELENEMVDCPAIWANHAIDVIRRNDAKTPVCVSHAGGGLTTADPLWWHRNTKIDFYNYHLYASGWPTTAEIDYGAAIDILTRYGRMCGPSMLGESSGDEFSAHPSKDTRRWVMRDIIWLALTNGNPGVFFWNARGAEVREFKLARQAMAQLNLATFKRLKPEIGIDVSHALNDDRWFRTPEGRNAYLMMGRYAQHYLSQGVDFDFTVKPAGYAKSCSLKKFAPPEPSKRFFEVGKGWQLSHLAGDDWREGLIYVRNLAGIEKWEFASAGRHNEQFLRKRAKTPLRLTFQLPEGRYDVQLYDLDEQKVSSQVIAGNGRLDLGVTDHDFALILKRR